MFKLVDPELSHQNWTNEYETDNGTKVVTDSINFRKVTERDSNGLLIRKTFTNNHCSLTYVEEYSDGKIASDGYYLETGKERIGKWRYYSSNGRLDRIDDQEKDFTIGFCQFIDIINKMGIDGKECEFELDREKRLWKVIQWKWEGSSATGTGVDISIDNGRVVNRSEHFQH